MKWIKKEDIEMDKEQYICFGNGWCIYEPNNSNKEIAAIFKYPILPKLSCQEACTCDDESELPCTCPIVMCDHYECTAEYWQDELIAISGVSDELKGNDKEDKNGILDLLRKGIASENNERK